MSDPEFDQQCAEARDKLPQLWWSIYSGCLEKGFTEEQALTLTVEYIKVISK